MDDDSDRWSDDEVALAHDLKRTCLVHIFLQSGSAYYRRMLHNGLTVPNICIGAVMSVSLFSTSAAAWRIATGVLAVASTILTSLTKQWSGIEMSMVHGFIVARYQNIVRDINHHLCMHMTPAERTAFLRRTKEDVDKLIMCQPEPVARVAREFETKYHRGVQDTLFQDFDALVNQHTVSVYRRFTHKHGEKEGGMKRWSRYMSHYFRRSTETLAEPSRNP